MQCGSKTRMPACYHDPRSSMSTVHPSLGSNLEPTSYYAHVRATVQFQSLPRTVQLSVHSETRSRNNSSLIDGPQFPFRSTLPLRTTQQTTRPATQPDESQLRGHTKCSIDPAVPVVTCISAWPKVQQPLSYPSITTTTT